MPEQEKPKRGGRLRASIVVVLAVCAIGVGIFSLSSSVFTSDPKENKEENVVADPSMFGMESPEPFVASDEVLVEDLLIHRRQALFLLREYDGEDVRIGRLSSGLSSDLVREELELVQLLERWGHEPETEFDASADPGEGGFIDPQDLQEYSAADGNTKDSMFVDLMLENQRSTLRLVTGEGESGVSAEAPQIAERISHQVTPLIVELEDMKASG